MIKFINNLKNLNREKGPARPPVGREQAGMTYVEIIVVLAIFGIMSSVVMYSYTEFQAKVDIKNLASDIALKIVEAQKSAMNGVLPANYIGGDYPPDWRPAYGVHFDISPSGDNKSFIYFADRNSDNIYNDNPGDDNWENPITITQNAYISGVKCEDLSVVDDIVFRRPDSRAQMICSENAQITVSSPRSTATATITVYPSGRVQVN